MMNDVPAYIKPIKTFLSQKGFPDRVDAVVILGSGLGNFASFIRNPLVVSYHEIPHFPVPSVQGHSGELFFGTINESSVIAFSGRFHHYEGCEFSKTVLPVHLANAYDVKKIVISNAAGAVNTRFNVGDLMVIDDVCRLFHKVSAAPASASFKYYHSGMAEKVRQIAAEIGLNVQRGTYLYVKGPNYETKAEIRAFRILGADVVGMSTAPELIEASRLEIPAAAISLVTNMAAGVLKGKLDHSEVKDAAEKRKDEFAKLVKEIIHRL
jgi:purine-nucleoside phosphorylase